MLLGSDVTVGLPPGLYLPTADEPVDQFRAEVFNHNNHPYEEVMDFGIFATAMAVLAADDKRPSFMPSTSTIDTLFDAGYGLSMYRLGKGVYGGLCRLQRTLRFYPEGYKAGEKEIMERCGWMASVVLPMLAEAGTTLNTMHDILAWGSKRNLLPSEKNVYIALNGNTAKLQSIFNIEKPNGLVQVTRRRLFQFGAKVLEENGHPLGQDELNARYASEFLGSPSSTIVAHHDSLGAFWEHYDRFKSVPRMGANKLLEIGVRLAIKNGGFDLSGEDIIMLSRQKRFASVSTIRREFGGSYPAYREAVRYEYEQFLMKAKELSADGVSDEVIKIIGASYSTDETYEQSVDQNLTALIKISADKHAARIVRSILRKGYDLNDDELWVMQVDSFKKSLTALGIKSPDEKRYITGLVPRN